MCTVVGIVDNKRLVVSRCTAQEAMELAAWFERMFPKGRLKIRYA